MNYRRTNIKNFPVKETAHVSLQKVSGENLRDLPQFLKPEFAQKIENYIIIGQGIVEKRKGRDLKFTNSAATSLMGEWTSDTWVMGFGTTIAVRTLSTSTTTNIKTDFSTNSGFKGVRYGDYFFVCNGVDKIWRLSRTLAYDGQSGNFTVGDIITGGTSGATAVVLQDSDLGVTGTLTLGTINGEFDNNETITSPSGGSATVDGTITIVATEVTNSPICSVLYVFGNRLIAGNLRDDPTAVRYSEVDDGTNPPFTTWSEGTLATDGGSVYFRNAGTVRDIVSLGQYVIVFADNGKWSFQITTIDSAGTLSKSDEIILSRIDFGGSRAIETNKGVFYVNESGLWQLVSVGQQDVPFSEQEVVTSEQLGGDYFTDIDFSDADIVYDPIFRIVYATCKDSSDSNNYVIGYAVDFKGFFRFTGWSLKRFLRVGADIYGTSSLNGEVFQLFKGTSDEGLDISTEYKQEINTNAPWNRSDLIGIYAQAGLDEGEEITIHFDIYDQRGVKELDAASFTMTTLGESGDADGFGEVGFGEASFGGESEDEEAGALTDVFAGAKPFVRNWQRVILRITSSSDLRHRLHWISLLTRDKGQIRNRQLTKI